MTGIVNRRRFLEAGAAVGAALLPGCRPVASRESDTGEPTAAKPSTGLLLDDIFQKHDAGPGDLEGPQRLTAIAAALRSTGLEYARIEPRPAAQAELTACHEKAYLEKAQREIEAGESVLSTGDTSICPESWRVASLAAGGVMAAVDAVLDGRMRNAFCAVRPPGHHAGPARGMGFCILNNVALAARYAQRKHGIGKLLIVDWDVHHGNGTQEIFDEDPSVLFFDTHQHPWYPGTGGAAETGKGKARGTKINVPLPAGTGRKQLVEAYETKLVPAAAKFKPEMVFISAGFDSHAGDPLGRFTLTGPDFAALTRLATTIAADHAQGRIVSVLEGGYLLDNLASAVSAHVGVLATA